MTFEELTREWGDRELSAVTNDVDLVLVTIAITTGQLTGVWGRGWRRRRRGRRGRRW